MSISDAVAQRFVEVGKGESADAVSASGVIFVE
jgi:hypothetical protein